MTAPLEPLGPAEDAKANDPTAVQGITAEFRRDLAFPRLSNEMVQRLQSYGREEIVPENTTLYTQGERDTDMFVVLEGELDVWLPSLSGGLKVFARNRRNELSGELN